MPTCSLCGTAFAYRTGWEPPEWCDCGANAEHPHDKKSRPEDYEPTEDELEARVAMVAVDLGARKP